MLDSTHTDQVTVEAETVEDALAEISAQFGENAEIMRAQKVHRGGVGGFFSKEMVQLTARRRNNEAPPLRPEPQGGGIADVLERMAQDADAEDSDFRTVLQRELGSGADETSSAGFLEAVGWDEPEAVPSLPAAQVIEQEPATDMHVNPPFADGEEMLEPVVVGPVLRSVPTPVDPDVEEEPIVAGVADSKPAEPVAGPVVPLRDPDDSNLDDAASLDVASPVEPPVAEVVAMVAQAVEAPELVALPKETSMDWRTAQPTDAPIGMGSISWSTTALLRLGLPGPIISGIADLDADDDLGWIERIAATVAPHCGPLPGGDVIVVGPHAERLAEPLGLPLVRSGDMAPYDGSFCAMVEDSADDRQWLEFVRGRRGIHLVVGDEPWQDLLIGEPVAVSWVGETAVADALYLAFTLGATLGFGTVDGFVSSMVRAQPTDVALAVRRIVGRR